MSTLSRIAAVTLLVSTAALASPSEAAESDRGPAYVEAHVLGGMVGVGDTTAGGGWAGGAFALELHGGYHLSGRHDGFVVGLTQKLAVGGGALGATLARLGWDFAIPIKRRELTIAPYGFGGALYAFDGGGVAAHIGAGIEARFFPIEKWEAEERGAVVEVSKRVLVVADHIEIREKIMFKTNEAIIENVSYSLLDEVAQVIRHNPQIKKLRVEGHASSDGDPGVNQRLSDARARAVRAHLVDHGGVSADALEAKGYGVSRPIASNDTDEGRDKNRRVEFNIVEQTDTVERVEKRRVRRGGAGSGLFVVAKPFELGFITGPALVTAMSFQAGLGYAF